MRLPSLKKREVKVETCLLDIDMNKGYTLIEVLSVLVVLAIIGSIVTINVTKYAKIQEEENYKKLKETIASSAEVYADEHDTILKSLHKENDKCKFSYGLLIDAGLVDGSQKDPRTKKVLTRDNFILVTVQDNYKLKYEFINVENGETTSASNCN